MNFPMQPHSANNILIASPSVVVRQRVLESLGSPVRRCEHAAGGAEALAHLESGYWQMLYLDRRLPDLDAEELSQTVRRRFPEIEVVLLDAQTSAEKNAQEKIKKEESGETSDQASMPGHNAIVSEAVTASNAQTRYTASEEALPEMIGHSIIMQPVYRAARLLAPRNTTVLITGPTGSGKEVVARAIHRLSPRAARNFAVVNCAAIPEALLEAELFGYARGAFTGAMQAYAGRIQSAQGGTLFLDEIGELPLSLQAKLLRFLEQKELQRLGNSDVVRVDVRVVAATNAHLLSLVREGKFRDDLYYRLCTFPIAIPPLRERLEDITLLARHFLEKLATRMPAPRLSAAAVQLLKTQSWPGNIRELQNVIERALILAEDQPWIYPEHLLFT